MTNTSGEYSDLFKTLRSKFAPRADHPAGVVSATDLKNILNALNQKDTQKISQVLPNFAQYSQQIINVFGTMGMYSGAASGGSQNSNNTSNATSNAVFSNSTFTQSAIQDLSNSLANALALLAQQKGLQRVVTIFSTILSGNSSGNFDSLCSNYQTILADAFSTFQTNVSRSGLNNYPIVEPLTVPAGASIPSPLVTVPPDFYAPQYHPVVNIPYPGFIQYINIANGDVVYVASNTTFATQSDAIIYQTEQDYLSQLSGPVAKGTLSAALLLSILDKVSFDYSENIHIILFGTGSTTPALAANNTASSSSSSSSSSGMSLVAMLLPLLNGMIQQADSKHLPKSVLNQGAVQQLLNKHGQNNAKAKMMAMMAKMALQPRGGSGGLSSVLSSLSKM